MPPLVILIPGRRCSLPLGAWLYINSGGRLRGNGRIDKPHQVFPFRWSYFRLSSWHPADWFTFRSRSAIPTMIPRRLDAGEMFTTFSADYIHLNRRQPFVALRRLLILLVRLNPFPVFFLIFLAFFPLSSFLSQLVFVIYA